MASEVTTSEGSSYDRVEGFGFWVWDLGFWGLNNFSQGLETNRM